MLHYRQKMSQVENRQLRESSTLRVVNLPIPDDIPAECSVRQKKRRGPELNL